MDDLEFFRHAHFAKFEPHQVILIKDDGRPKGSKPKKSKKSKKSGGAKESKKAQASKGSGSKSKPAPKAAKKGSKEAEKTPTPEDEYESEPEYIGFNLSDELLANDPRLCLLTMHRAIHIDDMELLKYLLVDYELPLHTGYELVRIAARRNNMEAVKLLVEFGCVIDRPPGAHLGAPAPVHFAAGYENDELLDFFISKGADMDAILTEGDDGFQDYVSSFLN